MEPYNFPSLPLQNQTAQEVKLPAWALEGDSAWERVKDAFRRDWEQTKADLSATDGTQLNQGALDTVQQALGVRPIPPLTTKSHADTPMGALRIHARTVEARILATQTIAMATQDILDEKLRLAERVVDIRSQLALLNAKRRDAVAAGAPARTEDSDTGGAAGQACVASHKRPEKTTQASIERRGRADADATRAISVARRESGERILKDQAIIVEAKAERTAASARWLNVEPAARYGYSVRDPAHASRQHRKQVDKRAP